MYTYKYKVIIENQNVIGYITANNMSNAFTIVKNITSKIVYINRCLFVQYVDDASRSDWFKGLSLLLNQGLRIENALEIMGEESKFRFSLNMSTFLKLGNSFPSTLDKHAFFFDLQARKIAYAVDSFMKLESLCDFLGEYYTKLSDRKNKFHKILLPPLLTLFVSILLCIVVLHMIKEPFTAIASDLGINKPLVLRLISHLKMKRFIVFISLFASSFVWLIRHLDKLTWFNQYYLNEDIYISLYCISNALKNGVDILNALEIGLSACQTSQMRNRFSKIRKGLLSGETLYNMFIKTGLNSAYSSIMRIYELSNDIAGGCKSVSELADLNIRKQFAYFINVITPILTICTALLLVIFLYITIFPIYTSISSFMF